VATFWPAREYSWSTAGRQCHRQPFESRTPILEDRDLRLVIRPNFGDESEDQEGGVVVLMDVRNPCAVGSSLGNLTKRHDPLDGPSHTAHHLHVTFQEEKLEQADFALRVWRRREGDLGDAAYLAKGVVWWGGRSRLHF